MEIRSLRREGYNVIHNTSGKDAVETVRVSSGQIDLILMDIDLGDGIDGTDAAKEILLENNIPIMYDRTTKGRHREYLDIINKSGEHLLGLINDVLETSRIESKRLTLNETTFDVRLLIIDLLNMFRFKAESRGLDLRLSGIESIPQFITADMNKLRQILINLMGNAVKFTEKGGIVLRFSHPDDSLRIICEVEDTGSGIPEDEINRLFQPFEQTVSGKSRTDGTGLGLFISREYARMMGGDITVTSRPGKGSIFRAETAYKQSLMSETRAGTQDCRPGKGSIRTEYTGGG